MKRQGSLISSIINNENCRSYALASATSRRVEFGSQPKLKCGICGQAMFELTYPHIEKHDYKDKKKFIADGHLIKRGAKDDDD